VTETTDVVVIGGGIVGCATALFLSRKGLKVHLVERDGVATGTSGCCMGHLMVTPDPADSYRLTRASVLLWQQLAEELGPRSLEYNPSGAFWLAESDEDMPLLEKLKGELESHGDSAEILDGDELVRREPGLAKGLPGAMFYRDDGVVMPMFAAGAMLRAAVANGAEVSFSRPVTGFDFGPGQRVQGVRTSRGPIAADHVVNAAGVWSPELTDLAGLGRAPVYPRRGDLAITMHHTAPVRSQLLEVAYLRVSMSGGGKAASPLDPEADPGAHAVNIQPQSNGSILIGSTRQFQSHYGRVVDRELLRTSLRRAARYLPGLATAPVVRTWAGLRPFSLDKNPIIGPVEDIPGFHMATGHEGLGITMSPITGKLVAQALVGETPDIPLDLYRLERFRETASRG